MKRFMCRLLVSSFLVLILTSCSEEKMAIDHSTEAPVSAASGPVVNGESDLILIQTESPSFPQSQGVYDFHENELTVVKQYLPIADVDDDVVADPQIVTAYEKQVADDFERHFSHTSVKMTNDPYQIYEATFADASYVIENDRLLFKTDDQVFTFIFDPDMKQVSDENGVRYDIQVDE